MKGTATYLHVLGLAGALTFAVGCWVLLIGWLLIAPLAPVGILMISAGAGAIVLVGLADE